MIPDMQGSIERAWAVAVRLGRRWLWALAQRTSARTPAGSEPPSDLPPPSWEQRVKPEPLHMEGYTLRAGPDHPRSLACEENTKNGWCPYAAVFARICPSRDEAEQAALAELRGKGPRGWILSERRLVVPIRVEADSVYDLRGVLTAEQARWVYDELYKGDGDRQGRVAWDLARSEPRCEGILLPTEPLTLFLFVDAFQDVVEERGAEEVSVKASPLSLQNVLDFVAPR
jgi:hypothetical protein